MNAGLASFSLGPAIFVAPLAIQAEQPAKQVARILLSSFPPSDAAPWHQAFPKGLRDLGRIEGKNITWSTGVRRGELDRLLDLAADFVRLKVRVTDR